MYENCMCHIFQPTMANLQTVFPSLKFNRIFKHSDHDINCFVVVQNFCITKEHFSNESLVLFWKISISTVCDFPEIRSDDEIEI